MIESEIAELKEEVEILKTQVEVLIELLPPEAARDLEFRVQMARRRRAELG